MSCDEENAEHPSHKVQDWSASILPILKILTQLPFYVW